MASEWNIEQVVESIETLYSTANPEEIKAIQSHLHNLQKSENGYQLARVLCGLSSKNCKFFGALTFAVIINQNKTFENDRLQVIINDIVNITRSLIQDDNQQNQVIIKKMLSNLSLLFIYNFEQLSNPIKILFQQQSGDESLQNYLPQLNENQFSVLLVFYAIIAEDVIKVASSADIHLSMKNEVFVDLSIVYEYLNSIKDRLPMQINLLGLSTLNSWISYISYSENNSTNRYGDDSNNLLQFLLDQFNTFNFDNISDETMEVMNSSIIVLNEILETNSSLFSVNFKDILLNLLFKTFGISYIDSIILNEERKYEYSEEIKSFINLLINFLSLDIIRISKRILTSETQEILNIVIKLTDYSGKAVFEESISEQFLTFWEDLANVYIDNAEIYESAFESNYDELLHQRNQVFNNLILIYWNKIQLPELSVFETNKLEFMHYRSQVADLFIVIYSLLNLSLYNNLTLQIVGSLNELPLNQNKLFELESSLYLLYKITDDLTFYDDDSSKEFIPFICQIFDNNLIDIIQEFPTEGSYKYIYSTLINFFSSIQFFYKQQVRYIGPTFNLIFSIILNNKRSNKNESSGGINNPLSLSASKTILKICQESRESLVEFLPNLQTLVLEILKDINIDNLIRERMCNSYISIAQCLKDPSEIGDIVSTLLNELYSSTLQIMTITYDETIEDYLISFLSCIYEVGKACQLPEEVGDFLTEEQQALTNQYWREDPLNIKQALLKVIKQFSLNFGPLTQNTTVTEKCCLILKAGINEPIDGPFQFSIDDICSYLITKINSCNLNSISYIFGLVETIIIVNYKELSSEYVRDLIGKIYYEKIELLEMDPDLIQCSLDLFSTILEKRPSLIISSNIFEEFSLDFAIKALESKESFVIKSVSKFWVTLITLKKGTLEDQNLSKELLINKDVGYLLVFNATKSFIVAPRSNLYNFYPIFRNLISKYSIPFKLWFKQALVEANVKNLVDEKQIDFFVNKLMITRGQRTVNDVLKTFWLQCNGFVEFTSRNY